MRRLATELAEMLPDWSSTVNPSVNLDYGGLKAAAIQMARSPECVQQAVIKAYSAHRGAPKLSGMYLLVRILFVLPSDYRPGSVGTYTPWSSYVVMEAMKTKTWNYQWPVLVHPQERVLEIERCRTGCDSGHYVLLGEFQWLKSVLRFPMRSPAEIEALQIRRRP